MTREPPFDLAELVGLLTDDARRRCEGAGFAVEVVRVDENPSLTLDLRPNRIRLLVRRGHVVEASQG